ncbi:hypothetical protein LL037_25190 (plasmid) [Clostridium estertheticum]|uniref:hypothetical protein n=1 Tax=Clostridium estertheticum TaxID=238834 RepID=UPI001C0DE62C|nr:hypothetical protein [Clostridium estertheticum]MBU3201802.1 hypothetical protein [Clostridium estertheticum]WAG68195.1 hypothetical protein LL037_25190 [Clostridium estertheticum]
MKLKIIGTIVGIIELTMMLFITKHFYKGASIFPTACILSFLVLQAAFYNRLSSKSPQKLIQKIVIINILLMIVSFALLPKYTYVEAKAIAQNKYKNELDHFVEFKSYSDNSLFIRSDNIKDIFVPHRFYYFYFVKNNGDKKYIMMNPSTGEIVELKNPM